MNETHVDDPWSEGLAHLFDLLRARGLRVATFAATSGRPLLERAEIELLHVHRIESARLLARAARMRGARASSSDDLARWRLDCAEHLRILADDDLACPRELALCARRALPLWPRARALARLAARLEPSATHRELCAELGER